MYLDGVLKFLHEFFEIKQIDKEIVIVEIVVNDKKRGKEEKEIVSFENFSFFTE